MTVIKEIERRNLIKNVIDRGNQLQHGLNQIVDEFPSYLNESRGIGLMQGLVLKENIPLTLASIVKEALKHNLLLIGAGENVIRLVPPLIINKRQTNHLIERLHSTLRGVIQ